MKKYALSLMTTLGLLMLAGCQSPQMSGTTVLSQSADGTYSEAPQQRRDLGTVWGESRESSMSMEQFTRQDRTKPDALAAIYYNDKAAVDVALANQHTRNIMEVTLARDVTLSVLDKDGDRMALRMTHDRVWLNGVDGERYSLKLVNSSPRSYEAVISIDGLSVMNGKVASYESDGYILKPNTTTLIEGFRTSQNSVATFQFGNAAISYATSKGSEAAQNIGVIGVALFSEKIEARDGVNPFPGQNDPRFAQPPAR